MIREHAMSPRRTPGIGRTAFTLVELLVVLVVMLLLVAMTASAVNVGYSRDRVRGAARQIQSYLMGARDLAIYAKAPRGVRFLADPTNPRQVSSMVLVQPTEPWNGRVQILPNDNSLAWNSSTNGLLRVRLNDTNRSPNWIELRDLGLLQVGARIRIPGNDRGTWYVVGSLDLPASLPTSDPQDLILTTAYRQPPPQASPATISETAEIELPPSIVPGKQPVQFSKGAVIDLDRCGVDTSASNIVYQYGTKLPLGWKIPNNATPPTAFRYISTMDVMFSPQGAITGLAASKGIIHLYITEQAAADLGLPAYYDPEIPATWPGTPPSAPFESVPDKNAVSIFTRTGGVIASPIFPADPFRYAERGEVAGR